MDIFLNQLIQFYSNNAINLHHLSTHSTTVFTYKMAIVLRPQICDVISPILYRRLSLGLHVHAGLPFSKPENTALTVTN